MRPLVLAVRAPDELVGAARGEPHAPGRAALCAREVAVFTVADVEWLGGGLGIIAHLVLLFMTTTSHGLVFLRLGNCLCGSA